MKQQFDIAGWVLLFVCVGSIALPGALRGRVDAPDQAAEGKQPAASVGPPVPTSGDENDQLMVPTPLLETLCEARELRTLCEVFDRKAASGSQKTLCEAPKLRMLCEAVDEKGASGAHKMPCEASGWQALCEHVDGKSPSVAFGDVFGPSGTYRGNTQVFVATVPDPDYSRQSAHLDGAIDALSSSMVAQGYLLERLWLPWKSVAQGPRSAGVSAQAQVGEVSRAKDSKSHPGVLVFRREGGEHPLLIVLLVGESPVFGIQRRALNLALKLARGLAQGSSKTYETYVLGPFFSGSAHSLWQGLENARRQDPSLKSALVITGSATADSCEDDRPAWVTFRRTVVRDSDMNKFMFDTITKKWQRPSASGRSRKAFGSPRVALLIEAGTAYGGGYANLRRKSSGPVPAVYRFPLHISRLRAARERDKPAENGNGVATLDLKRTLTLKFDASAQEASDIVPTFSDVTAFEAELTLQHTLREIARRRFNYLAIVATDPADFVFIAREARVNCPDAQLIAVGADILYTHPDLASSLGGMLVVSSYPLILDNQRWRSLRDGGNSTGGTTAAKHKSFVSDVSQGVYNAAMLLIHNMLHEDFCEGQEGHLCSALDVCDGRNVFFRGPAPLLLDGTFSWTTCHESVPRAWLSVVAQGRFWPLAVDEPTAREPVSKPPTAAPKSGPEPPSTAAGRSEDKIFDLPLLFGAKVAFLFLLVLFTHLFVLWASRRPILQGKLFIRLFRPVQGESLGPMASRYALAACLIVVAFGFYFVVSALHYFVPKADDENVRSLAESFSPFVAPLWCFVAELWSRLWPAVCLVVLPPAMLLLMSLWRFVSVKAAAAYRAPRNLRPRARVRNAQAKADARRSVRIFNRLRSATRGYDRFVTLVSWLLFGYLVYLASYSLYGLWTTIGSNTGLLTVLRLTDPSGMCPLVPLFFVAVGLYLWAVFGLARLQLTDLFPRFSPFASGLGLPAADLRHLVSPNERREWPGRAFVEAVVVFVLALPFLHYYRRVFPTFEWQGFEPLVKWSLIVLCGAVVLACVHFMLLWTSLRKVLVRLVATPMADAYDRIGAKFKGSFGLSFAYRVPEPDELYVSVRSCKLLAAMASNMPGDAGVAQVIRDSSTRLEGRAKILAGAMEDRRESWDDDTEKRKDGIEDVRMHHGLFTTARLLSRVLDEVWARRAEECDITAIVDRKEPQKLAKDLLPTGDLSGLPTAAVMGSAVSPECQLWTRTAEDFVAMRNATFVHYVIHHIRLLVTFALLGSILVVLAVFSYPLHPRGMISVSAGMLSAFVAVCVLRVIIGMQCNELLQRLARGRPGELNFNFSLLRQLVLYIVLPGLVAAARLFPEFGHALVGWIEPLWMVFSLSGGGVLS